MKLTPNSFFSDLKFQEIDLNYWFKEMGIFGNKPKEMETVLNKIHKNGEKFTYGGYGENRRDMWKGTYIEKSRKYYHLGIDINVPAYTHIIKIQ